MLDPFLGEVATVATNWAPEGWIMCQGQLLSTAEADGLFTLLGSSFGGDGVSTFGLPNFSALTPAGVEYCIAFQGESPLSARPARPAYTGEVALFPYSPPRNWINCDGKLIEIAENESLFSILGATFGGDGKTTFAVPDLRRLPPTLDQAPGPSEAQGTAPVLPETIYSICSNGWPADGVMGEIKLFPPAHAPTKWWLPCDGRLLPLQQNTALYSLIGSVYGGDGRNTFAIPDLSQASPRGLEYFICAMGLYPARP
jgi:microcystin-dependent protein